MITLLWLLSSSGRAIKIDSSFKRFMPSLLLFLVFTHTSVEVCVETGHPIEVCDMKFAPKPLVDHILVPTVGISEIACVSELTNFHWEVGVYCEDMLFCGLGLDMEKDHEQFLENKPSHSKYHCEILVDTSKFKCDSVVSQLKKINLIEDASCLYNGGQYCDEYRGTYCAADYVGGFRCEGCLEYFEPSNLENPNDLTNCTDIDECELGICNGEEFPCTNRDHTYECDCGFEHTYSAKKRTGCERIHEGWDLGLIYSMKNSQMDFFALLRPLQDIKDKSMWTFVRSDFHDNIRKSDEIRLIIYGSNRKATQEFIFRGVGKIGKWFEPENIISSSFWEMTSEDSFGVFRLTYDAFEISLDEPSVPYFLLMNCPEKNDHFYVNNENFCKLRYSASTSAAAESDLEYATKIEILTRSYTTFDHQVWNMIFRFSSFSEVNFKDFYLSGGLKTHETSGLYRDPELISTIQETDSLIVAVFFGDEKISLEIFELWNATINVTTWFNKHLVTEPELTDSKIYNFSGHDLFTTSNFLNIGKMTSSANCDEHFGWLTVWCPFQADLPDVPCSYNTRWEESAQKKFSMDECVILHAKKPEGAFLASEDIEIAERLEIYTRNESLVKLLEYRRTDSNPALLIVEPDDDVSSLEPYSYVRLKLATDSFEISMPFKCTSQIATSGIYECSLVNSEQLIQNGYKEVSAEFGINMESKTGYLKFHDVNEEHNCCIFLNCPSLSGCLTGCDKIDLSNRCPSLPTSQKCDDSLVLEQLCNPELVQLWGFESLVGVYSAN